MLLILSLLAAFLFPLGIYCLILAALNRRERPLLVSGPWDFAGVLFAASGLLLFVGPAVLTAIYQRRRFNWLLGGGANTQGQGVAEYYLWLAIWFVYFVAVVGGSAWMLRRRRQLTAVYNVDVAALEVGLARVLERLGVPWRRKGNYFILQPRTTSADATDPPTLEVEAFPAMCHASLRWHAVDRPTRQALEKELDHVLAALPPSDNPIAGWFLSIGASLLLLTLMCLGFVVAVNLRFLRG